MSNIGNLTSKILKDAEVKRDNILAVAEEEKAKILNKKKDEAKTLEATMLEKAKSEAQTRKERVISSAELKARNEKLQAKQTVIQEVFEKAAELTYAIIHGDNIETLSYDIKDAFSYFQLSVPTQFQMRLDGVVGKLDDVVLDIISFINKKDYDLCNKETWLRPILFNLALDGMLYTLENYRF